MKKRYVWFITTVFCLSLIGCGSRPSADISCGHEAYGSLLQALEEGNYQEAQAIILEMENQEGEQSEPVSAPTVQTETSAVTETVPENLLKGTVVELTEENVNDYFEIVEEYSTGAHFGCTILVKLKKEFQEDLVSVDQVVLDVSYIPVVHYGQPDKENEEFESEYFDPISSEVQTKHVEIPASGEGHFLSCSYNDVKKCFEFYPLEIELSGGRGSLIFGHS